MKSYRKIVITLSFIIIAIIACKKSNDNAPTPLPPYDTTGLTIVIPSNLPQMQIPSYNPTTVKGVALGRKLYYDKLLHPTGAKSCSTCHIQSNGFTTTGTNVIPHINLGYSNKFLWDGKWQGTLEDAMLKEVEVFFNTDVSRLQNDANYPTLFYQVFGTTTITTKECAYALAQFVRTMISGNSKFDKFMRHELWLAPDELYGYQVFYSERGDCFHCHSLSLTTDGNLHNNGLDSVFIGDDAGYYNTSNNPADLGKFKTPSLRNCAIRTQFMHDGRFKTLDEVIAHYNSGVKITPSVDPIMTKPGKEYGLLLSPAEKQQLKAFLITLTDSAYLTNPAFTSPF